MERNGTASNMGMDVAGSDDLRQCDRSVRPTRVTKRRKRASPSCTECRRRKRKCDGKLPCCDCNLRDRADGCHYADGAIPHSKEGTNPYGNSAIIPVCSPTSTMSSAMSTIVTGSESDNKISISRLGYARTGVSTADFLDKIEVDADEAGELETSHSVDGHGDLWERYILLVKQLPARGYIEKLAEFYFRQINWQYYALDEGAFRHQLQAWYLLDLQTSATGIFDHLSADLRAFPALLFELAAISLLLMTPEASIAFGDFKPIDSISSETMAVEYSESGVEILRLLGKRQVSLTTVFSDFLRVAFLKYLGQVTEAWHALGEAVKDAQEIGLHQPKRDPRPRSNDIGSILENQWVIQDRRRIWMIISGWDIHTAMVLGRPAAVDDGLKATLPVDAFIAVNRSTAPVLPRGEDDIPTPLTRAIWAFRIINNLRKVRALEKEGSCPRDFSHVDHLDQEMRDLEKQIPPFFRLHNPDRRFDSTAECSWIPGARATLSQLLSFNFMALHRPYIFTRAASRPRALEACLEMLEAQREHFDSIDENQYKTFFLFFGTFDAIVLMASIYIFFPSDHLTKVAEAVQHFQWSIERFEAMSDRNSLAKAALDTSRTCFAHLKRALNGTARQPSVDALTVVPDTPDSSVQPQTARTELDSPVPYPGTVLCSSTSGPSPPVTMRPEFQSFQPPAAPLDWSLIEPIYAMGDIAYNDLIGSLDYSMTDMSQYLLQFPSGADLPQFSGDFGENSVWSVLNQDIVHR